MQKEPNAKLRETPPRDPGSIRAMKNTARVVLRSGIPKNIVKICMPDLSDEDIEAAAKETENP